MCFTWIWSYLHATEVSLLSVGMPAQLSMTDRAPACSGVAVVDALDAALENLSEFSISVRELGRYVQNLGKERAYFTLDIEDLAR